MKKLILSLLVVATSVFCDTTDNNAPTEYKQSGGEINYSHLVYESLAGLGGGLLLGTFGLAIGYTMTKSYDSGLFAGLTGAAIGGGIGYTIGNTLGVALVGNKYQEKGSLVLSYLGSIGFLALGILIDSSINNKNGINVGIISMTLPIVGSSTGYHIGCLINKEKVKIF